ncbi:hypothetical protein GORDON_56 [Arthrobacter phage Gordon]|uniref:Uncharacterized protein n=1 Tax=Arthrobacter phage Gordon TaxID=1772298 RepID=A0A0U4IUL2_9CAUD|nr:hypothetical protein FDH69_gp56 [Arthrobacter phage Gordon]ALY09031.1 hypothetical protein GORDON_56 [Arthrobacter phage Gordon]
MSGTQNNPEDIDPLEQSYQDGSYHDAMDAAKEQQERLELAGSVENGAAELLAELDNLPQAREVILPVIMRKGAGLAVLGDAVFDPETNKMVVSFNTEPGRNIAEFIGSGMLAAISFTGHMHKKDLNG